jgi:uncharacterized protein
MDFTQQPLLARGQVRHARRRPAMHRFAYRVFFLRLPLRTLAAQPPAWRWLKFNRPAIFAINDADHGDGRPLLDWIDGLLRGAGIDDADGEIWLHTFPRVAGYVFNPVSFWIAHRADGALRAIVCEVNNTFGERHAYLLAHPDGRTLTWGEELTATKALHVSPFCSMQGQYRFRLMLAPARDAHPARFVARIDYDDEQGPLLETSISGELGALTDRALARAFLAFPLFTLGVIARIHWQAAKLWFKRVPYFTQPADPAQSLNR